MAVHREEAEIIFAADIEIADKIKLRGESVGSELQAVTFAVQSNFPASATVNALSTTPSTYDVANTLGNVINVLVSKNILD